MNKNDELLLKLMLTLARDRRAMQGRVRSVGFMREYLALPNDLGVHTLTQMNDEETEALALSVSIKPKSAAAHFHFYLNDTRYRLVKSEQEKIALLSRVSIDHLSLLLKHAAVSDEAIVQSLVSRDGIVKLSQLPNMVHQQLQALIEYVIFVGTEQGAALHQAEGLFIFEDALNMNSWTIMTKEQAIFYTMLNGYFYVQQDGQPAISLYLK